MKIRTLFFFLSLFYLCNSCDEKIKKKNTNTNTTPTNYTFVVLQEENNIIKIENYLKTPYGTENVEGKTLYTSVGLFSKDSIVIYDYLNQSVNREFNPEIFSLLSTKKENTKKVTYSRDIGNRKIEDSLLITFKDENKVLVNNNTYYLSPKYYKYLKKQILDSSLIYPLISLLNNDLSKPYTNFNVLSKNWFPDPFTEKEKIIKADVFIESEFTENIYPAKIKYKYKNGELVTASMDSNIKSIEKKLIAENKIYEIYEILNKKERDYSSQKLFYNKLQNSDSLSTTLTQYPNNITTSSLYYQTLRIQHPIEKLHLKQSEITDVILMNNINAKITSAFH